MRVCASALALSVRRTAFFSPFPGARLGGRARAMCPNISQGRAPSLAPPSLGAAWAPRVVAAEGRGSSAHCPISTCSLSIQPSPVSPPSSVKRQTPPSPHHTAHPSQQGHKRVSSHLRGTRLLSSLFPFSLHSMASPPPPCPPRKVADSLVDYLASEIVAYYGAQDVVPPTAALDAIGKEEERWCSLHSLPQLSLHSQPPHSLSLSLGFRVGYQLVERHAAGRPRLGDSLDIVKFVCKDLWTDVFGKQVRKGRGRDQNLHTSLSRRACTLTLPLLSLTHPDRQPAHQPPGHVRATGRGLFPPDPVRGRGQRRGHRACFAPCCQCCFHSSLLLRARRRAGAPAPAGGHGAGRAGGAGAGGRG